MSVKVLYSRLALNDLDDIWTFLAIDCSNTKAAERTINGILDDLDRLVILPESGTPLDSRCIIHSDYRFVVSGNYLAFYLVEGGCVHIVRVLDGRSDYLRKLFGTGESAIGSLPPCRRNRFHRCEC